MKHLLVNKILEGLVSTSIIKKVSENKNAIAFWHPRSLYSHHVLIIPKKRIKDIRHISKVNENYILDCLKLIDEVANLKEFNNGFHLTCNSGEFQKFKQLHFHLYRD